MPFSPEQVAAIDEKYNLRPFVDAPPTKEDLDPLTLTAIDLSLFEEGPENLHKRQDLANILAKSITTYGFFNVTNFGVSPEEIEHLRSVAQSLLELPHETQLKYLASAPVKEEESAGSIGGERGQGFKPKGYWAIKEGVRDSISLYNIRDVYHKAFLEHPERHPEILQAHLEEVTDYYKTIHLSVLPKLLRLCDLILGIEEGTLAEKYFAGTGTEADTAGSHGRLMLYTPYNSEESSLKTESTFLRGHSDLSAFAFITSQPVLALQIKDVYSGNWRYVNHRPNSLVVNVGDALEFITGGYFKACLHRVVEPPKDQLSFNRLVLIYFVNPSDDSLLDPESLNSPKLRELGLTKDDQLKSWEKIEFKEWNSFKGQLLGRTDAGKRNLLQIRGRFVERWHHFETEPATV